MLRKRIFIAVAILFILLLLGAGGLIAGYYYMLAPVASPGSSLIPVEVPAGASAAAIGELLTEAGVIRNPLVFRIYARLNNLEQGFIAGKYLLDPALDLAEIAAVISSGAVHRETEWFTVPEGFTVEQIAARLAEQGLVDQSQFLQLAQNPPASITGALSFLELPDDPDIIYALEGYLFPDTYEVEAGASAEEIIILMLRRMESVFNEERRKQCAALGMSIHEVLTLASIVERETIVEHELALISGVFHNRLAIGMALGSCATVNYLLPEVKEVLSEQDTKIDSPYNTYQNPGLPPGPIAAPGEAAIDAALNPVVTDYLYFRTKEDGSGESYFARTAEEHEANSRKAEENKRNSVQ